MIWAMWHGGSSYSHGDMESDLEVFPSIRAAGRALLERYEGSGWRLCEIHYADGRTESTLMPAVDAESCSMTLWRYDPRAVSDPYPDRILTLGPRIGIRMERC